MTFGVVAHGHESSRRSAPGTATLGVAGACTIWHKLPSFVGHPPDVAGEPGACDCEGRHDGSRRGELVNGRHHLKRPDDVELIPSSCDSRSAHSSGKGPMPDRGIPAATIQYARHAAGNPSMSTRRTRGEKPQCARASESRLPRGRARGWRGGSRWREKSTGAESRSSMRASRSGSANGRGSGSGSGRPGKIPDSIDVALVRKRPVMT